MKNTEPGKNRDRDLPCKHRNEVHRDNGVYCQTCGKWLRKSFNYNLYGRY